MKFAHEGVALFLGDDGGGGDAGARGIPANNGLYGPPGIDWTDEVMTSIEQHGPHMVIPGRFLNCTRRPLAKRPDYSDLVDALSWNVRDRHGLRPLLDERHEFEASSLANSLRITNSHGRISNHGGDTNSADGHRPRERTSSHFVHCNENRIVGSTVEKRSLELQRGCGRNHG